MNISLFATARVPNMDASKEDSRQCEYIKVPLEVNAYIVE